MALRVKETDEDVFEVAGPWRTAPDHPAGKHAPRRLRAGRVQARVVFKDIDGVRHEPIELVTADIEEGHQGGVMQAWANARANW